MASDNPLDTHPVFAAFSQEARDTIARNADVPLSKQERAERALLDALRELTVTGDLEAAYDSATLAQRLVTELQLAAVRATPKPKTAYQHAQAIAKAIKASEAGVAYGAENLTLLSGAEHRRVTGFGDAPAILWEEGPYEWGITFTGYVGEKLGELATDEATRTAYAAMRADGFYLECSNSFTLAVYRA